MNQGKIKILVKGCNITQRTANPEGQKNRHIAVGGFFMHLAYRLTTQYPAHPQKG